MSESGSKSDERLRGWLALGLVAAGGLYAAQEAYNRGRIADAQRSERIRTNTEAVAELRAEARDLANRVTTIEARIGSKPKRRR